jgi:uncharacterized protein
MARLKHAAAVAVLLLLVATGALAQGEVPELTQPVNDLAGVIDAARVAELDRMIRTLQRATGDVIVVATIQSYEPFADIREYAVKMFENRGRGIGQAGKQNGILVLVAVKDRKVWIEVGYGLEEFITDGYAGETSRQFMIPAFRTGDYGAGIQSGVARLALRLAEARHVTLEDVNAPVAPRAERPRRSVSKVALLIVGVLILMSLTNRRRGPGGFAGGGWGGSGWSGWNSGIGSFGSGGGSDSGGFGGGFGGFGGGSSGGGGGGGSW